MDFDHQHLKEFRAIIGCDEVGRGPLAGPVVGCALRLTREDRDILNELDRLRVTDSKKLTAKKRREILDKLDINLKEIKLGEVVTKSLDGNKFSFCVYEHDHEQIDEMNILKASLSAMQKASETLSTHDAKVLIDGNKVFESIHPVEAVVKGDSKVLAIGLASVIAKEFRDEKMKELDKEFPGYNLAKHAGYPTKEHRDAIKKLGPSKIHRKSFKGVKEYIDRQ